MKFESNLDDISMHVVRDSSKSLLGVGGGGLILKGGPDLAKMYRSFSQNLGGGGVIHFC